ncbi:MAG: hypothetical protein ACWGQW_12295 [bacterium]
MADDAKNSFWADLDENGIPDKVEAIGGIIGKFAQGVIKTLKYLGLEELIESMLKHLIEAAATRVVDKVEDKWLGK